jgi:hypothetical protein
MQSTTLTLSPLLVVSKSVPLIVNVSRVVVYSGVELATIELGPLTAIVKGRTTKICPANL